MAKAKPSPQQLDEIRQLAAQWGKIVLRRFTPEAARALDFTAMEQIAAAAAAGLTEATLVGLLDLHADPLQAEHPCPECGRACPLHHEDRLLTVKGGTQIPLHEPVGHCPDCRRDFFPPPASPGPG